MIVRRFVFPSPFGSSPRWAVVKKPGHADRLNSLATGFLTTPARVDGHPEAMKHKSAASMERRILEGLLGSNHQENAGPAVSPSAAGN